MSYSQKYHTDSTDNNIKCRKLHKYRKKNFCSYANCHVNGPNKEQPQLQRDVACVIV